jgi:ethanolamine utilization protein EutQ (cupin superfamily)
MQQQDYCFRIDEKSIKNISKSIASEVADKIYCDFLLARYMPEVLEIEKSSNATIKTEYFKQQLMNRINSMAK